MLWVGSVISRQVWLRLLIFVIVITTFTNTVSANKIKGIETRLIQGVSVMPDSRSASKLGTNTKRLQKRTSTAALGNSRPSLSDSLERVLGPKHSHVLKSEGGPMTSPPIRNVVANSSGVLTKRLQNRTSKAALGNSRPSLSDSSERWTGPTHTLELTSHSEHKLTKSNAASAMTHYVVRDYITKEKKDFESEIEGLVDSLASYVLEGLESTVLGEGEKTVNGTRPGKWNYTVEYEQPQLDLHTFITGGGSVEEDSSKSLLVLGPEPPLPAPVVTTTTTMTPTVMPVTFFTTTKRGSFYKMKPQKGNQHSEDLLGPNKYPLQSNNYFYHSYQVGSHQAKPAFVGASPTKSPLPPDSLVQRPVPKVWLHLYPKYKPTSPPYSAPSMADKPHATPVKYPDSSNPMSQVQESKSSDFSYKPTSRPKQLGSGPLQSNMAHHISMQSNLVQNFQNNIGTGSFGAHNGGQHIKTEEISPSIQYKPTSRPMEPSLPNHDLHTNDVQYKPTSKPVMPPKSTMRPLISRPNPTEASLWPGNHPGSVNHPASTQDSGGNIPWSPVAGQIMGVFHYKPTHTPEQLQHPKPIASAIDSSQNSVPSTSTTVPTTTTEESTTASTLPPTYKPTVKPGVLVTDLDFNIPNRPVNLPIDLSQQVEAQPTAPTTTTTTTKAATILVSLTSTAPTTARTTTTTTPSSGVNPSTTTTVPTSQVFDLYDLVESLAISIDEFLRGIFDINYIGKTLSDLTAALVDTGSDTSVLLLVFGIPLLTAILTFAGVGPLIIIAIAWVVPVAAALLLPSTTSSFKEELEASASRLFNLR